MEEEQIKEVYVFLDESGHIHKNSNCNFFAIGGFMCLKQDKNKIKSTYKKKTYTIKKNKKIKREKELKSFDFDINEKIDILSEIQDFNSFIGVGKVFDKTNMWKKIDNENVFYNYAVKILFKDIIKPNILNYKNNETYKIILSLDNRSIKTGDLKNLQDYLNTEFILSNFVFEVTYYDSKQNYNIQLADLIVNSIYNIHKYKLRKDFLTLSEHLKPKNFKYSVFPYKKREP